MLRDSMPGKRLDGKRKTIDRAGMATPFRHVIHESINEGTGWHRAVCKLVVQVCPCSGFWGWKIAARICYNRATEVIASLKVSYKRALLCSTARA